MISLINTYDAVIAFHEPGRRSASGSATSCSWLNVVLLWAYTRVLPLLPAHHRRPAQALLAAPGPLPGLGLQVSKLNAKHMQLAWITLGTLLVTDFYVMAVAAGWISDLRFIS